MLINGYTLQNNCDEVSFIYEFIFYGILIELVAIII